MLRKTAIILGAALAVVLGIATGAQQTTQHTASTPTTNHPSTHTLPVRLADYTVGGNLDVTVDALGIAQAISNAVNANLNRTGWVDNMVNTAWNNSYGHYNVLVFNLNQSHNDDIPQSEVQFYGSAVYSGITFGIWVFGDGTWDNYGDGGYINWEFKGSFNRTNTSGDSHVVFHHHPGGTIWNSRSQKCADVEGRNTTNGTPVQLWDCNGTDAQWWIWSGHSLTALGKCLDVPGSSTTDGAKVQLYDCNGTGAQQWYYQSGALRNPESNKCLDITGGDTTSGNQLEIWDCTGAWNQTWTSPRP